MRNSKLARRKLIHGSLTFAATSWLLRSKGRAENIAPTPQPTPGPFCPLSFPQDSDNDLVQVSGHSVQAKGFITRITGRILDKDGSLFLKRGSRFGSAMRTVAITMCGTIRLIDHSMQLPGIRDHYDRSDWRTPIHDD